MKLDDLRHVSLTARQPQENMTDEQWQEYFAAMKLMVKQGKEKKMRSSSGKLVINGYSVECEYHGETSYTRYCQFINSVLKTIRGSRSELPAHDYCFFIYQIADLLRFEHDNLNVVWRPNDKCFEVWLDK